MAIYGNVENIDVVLLGAVTSEAIHVVGKDGITPTIGDNGNWFIGDTDTGKPSRGEDVDISPDDIADAVEDYLTEHPVTSDTYDANRYDPEQIQVIRYMPSIPEAMTASIVPSLLGSPVTEISEDAATVPSATSSTVYALGYVVRQLAMLLMLRGSLQKAAETLDKVFIDFLKLVNGGYITLPFYIHFGLNANGEIIPNNYISISRSDTAYIVRVSCRDEGTKNYSYYLCYYYDEGAAPASATGRVDFSALQPYKWLQHAFYSTADDGKILTLDSGNAVFKPLIVNDLTTDDTSKVLSAAQGKALKELIDNIDTSGSGGSTISASNVVTFYAVATGTTSGSSVVLDELADGQTVYDAVKAAYSAGKEVLLNVTNSADDWDTILRISKVNSNDDTIMFSNAEICETGEADMANEEMRLQWVVLKSDSTAAYYYVNPANGIGEKQWMKIIDTEVTEETSAFTVDGLDNYTEFYAKWSKLKNKSDATASALVLKINDAEIAAAAVPTAATSGTGLYGWTKVEYNGLAWEVQKSQGAIASTNITFANMTSPYNLVDGVGAATKISLAVGNAMLYAVTSGKLEVWGR